MIYPCEAVTDYDIKFISSKDIDIDTLILDLYKLTELISPGKQTNININEKSNKYMIIHYMIRNINEVLSGQNFAGVSRDSSNNAFGGYYRRKNNIRKTFEFILNVDPDTLKGRLTLMLNKLYDPPYNFYLIEIYPIYKMYQRNKELSEILMKTIGFISKKFGLSTPYDEESLDMILEDLRDNNIDYKFDVDMFDKAMKHIESGFNIKEKKMISMLSKNYNYYTENQICKLFVDMITKFKFKLSYFDIPDIIYENISYGRTFINIYDRIKFVWTLDKEHVLYNSYDYLEQSNNMELYDFHVSTVIHPDDKRKKSYNQEIYTIIEFMYNILIIVEFTDSRRYTNFINK